MSGVTSIVLVVHMLIVVAMIGVVLLQRSEGGALGIGGGSGSFLSAAGAGNALTRATMILAALFFTTSIVLTVLSRNPNKELDLQGQPVGKVTAPQPAGTNGPASAPQPAPQSAPLSGGPGAPASSPQSAPGQTGASAPVGPAPAPSQTAAPPASAPAGTSQPAPQPAQPPHP